MSNKLRQRQQAPVVESSPTTKGDTRKKKGATRNDSTKAANYGAIWLLFYYFAMMATRFQHRGFYAFLDTAWLCNFNLLLAATGMAMRKPSLIGACLTAVFIVHCLWIVDVVTWWLKGIFPIGLAAYVAWPDTTWGEIITSTHHVWFSPLCFYVMFKLRGHYVIKSWLISIVLIIPVLLGSLFVPEEIILENGEPFYLNINMAHGWWKDVNSWPFSLIPTGNPSYIIFLHAFVFFKFTIAYLVLKVVTKYIIKK